jgi:predicted permease
MQTLIQDLRYTARQLWSSKGLTFLAVLTLALGIGSNAALFTVVESVLLRPLPYKNADQLTYIGPQSAQPSFAATSWLNYKDIRDQAKSFSDVAGYSEDLTVLDNGHGLESVQAPHLTVNTFAMLGAAPLLGRTFNPEEGLANGPQVVLLSESVWRKSFHADPNILGREVNIAGKPHAVIGVMPSTFHYPEGFGPEVNTGIWLPLQPTPMMMNERGYNFFTAIGQLRRGVTLAQAQSELNAIAARINAQTSKADPTSTRNVKLTAVSYQGLLTGPIRSAFYALVAALALVLLIACANVANLLLARALGRQQEFGVRVALGASRTRLVRQMLTEGGVLSLLGCICGLALAQGALSLVHKLPSGTIPRADAIAMHWTILASLAAIATITTLLSSLLPSLLVVRTNPQSVLQAASRGLGARSGSNRLSHWLVISEVALSTLLLIGTGLLFHTLWNLQHAQLGFELQGLTTFSAMPADAAGFTGMSVSDAAVAPPSAATLTYAPVLERIRHLPGVQAAALITAPPLSGFDIGSSFEVLGQPKDPTANTRVTAVSGDYAQALDTTVLRGRMITESDTAAAPFVAVVNQAFATKYFKTRDPLQQQLDLGDKDTGMLKPYTIIGVIEDQTNHEVGGDVQPLLFLPYQQVPTTSLFYAALLNTVVNFVVKTRGDVTVIAPIRDIFHQLGPGYALDDFKSMQQVVDDSLFSQRLGLYLTGAFAGLAVLMLIAGLYGVLAQVVSYRRREIGIRMALGATRQSMAKMILHQSTILIGLGLGTGLFIATVAGQLIKSFLYQVPSVDAPTYAAVILFALVIGLIASVIPAHKAASIEPMEALRED